MCEYCKNLETGNDIKTMVSVPVDFGDLDSGDVYAHLERNDKNEPCLAVGITLDAPENTMQNYRKIHFCPICGRKLE